MKKSHLIGSLVAAAAIVAAVYLTNVGQEMAVRVGTLGGEELHRILSWRVLNEARAATASTDPKKVMIAFHMILNALLFIVLATVAVGGALLMRRDQTKRGA